MMLVSYVESGQLQVISVGSAPPRGPREVRPSPHLFFWNLQQEVHLSSDFVVHPIRWDRCPFAAADLHARAWLTLQSHRGLARNTLDAYSRAVERYFRFLAQLHFSCISITRAEIGIYLASLQANGAGLSNATMQQLLTVVHLFHAYLTEEGVRANNPAATNHAGRPLIARHHKLPWIPNDDDWHSILAAARQEPIRNRVMLAFAYDAGLRREELCSLCSDDIDPSRRMLRIRAETTKGRRERVVPYSVSSSELLHCYILHRRTLGQKRGPLFLSESRRNYTEPISIWSWSKVVLGIARRAHIERFSTHTLRHLCLTDLARAGWDIHEIAAFASHRSIQTTLFYIHLSGRNLSAKLAASMSQIAVAYLLCGFSDLHRLSKNHIVYVVLARKVFGREYMKVAGPRNPNRHAALRKDHPVEDSQVLCECRIFCPQPSCHRSSRGPGSDSRWTRRQRAVEVL
jgi:integrase/recombinase XerD